jgi:GNAT superfamily N-acetyltransferase
MSYVVRDYEKEDLEDARKLAEMFNDWDSLWPGGFTRGVQETPERTRENMKRHRHLAVCISETGDEFAGFCSLEAQAGQRDLAYVGLLGARPAHLGKGVGKMLLREAIRRVTDLGYQQLSLHTWAGNMKAVPLYKKTGFFWVPETSVYMRNFLPAVLSMPAGRAFFADRDWYACMERDLTVAPDDILWKGMKVYPYRFRDGDDYLGATFDAASERLTALETPAYSVSCSIPIEEGAAGETYPIVWEIVPQGGRPLEVTLLVEPQPGLDIRVQERFVVERETTLTRELRLLPDVAPRREGEAAHSVRSVLLIDGQPITLETGVKIVRPVEIQYSGQRLLMGREEKIIVRLRNRLDRDVEGQLAWEAHPALTCEPPARDFVLPAKSWTEREFTLSALQPGAHTTRLRLEAGSTQGSRSIAFRAFEGMQALAGIDSHDDEQACLESPGLRIETSLRGGWMSLLPAGQDRRMVDQRMAELGPPFTGWRLRPPLLAARVEKTEQGETLTLTAPSQEFPGLTVERAASLLGDNIARIDYRVLNTTGHPLPAQLRCESYSQLRGSLVYPAPDGLIREPTGGWGQFPESGADILAHDTQPAETWFANEEEGYVAGMIWQKGPKVEVQRQLGLTFDLGEVPAHGMKTVPPIYLIAGSGNWETVRNWWRRLIQPSGVREAHKPEPGRVLELRSEPSPALLFGDRRAITLALRNRREKKLTGTLTLQGDTFSPEPADWTLTEVDRDHPFTAEIPLTIPAQPAAGFLDARITDGPTTEHFRVPVVSPGGKGEVRVTNGDDGQFVIENGLLTLRASAAFRGAMTALEREGVNHLFSAWPAPRPFQWSNPWHGGLYPYVDWPGDTRLARETFTGEPVERRGEQGLLWSGVRMTCLPAHKDLRCLQLEVEYLTVPESNVVAVLSRWRNRTDAYHEAWGGVAAWLQPGGTRTASVAHWERNGERRHRRRGGFPAEARSGVWAAVENTETEDILLLITSQPGGHTNVEDYGAEGPHLEASGTWALKPNGVYETLTWLISCRELEQIDAYAAALAQARSLP